jgi:hypothetical protein
VAGVALLLSLHQPAGSVLGMWNERELVVLPLLETKLAPKATWIVEWGPPIAFDRYVEVKFYLEDQLGTKVDLVSWNSLKSSIRALVEQEAISV